MSVLHLHLFVGLMVTSINAQTTNDATSCAASTPESYDLGLHITSVFVLLVASGIGVFLPVLMASNVNQNRDSDRDKFVRRTFFVLKYFGTGIIISLAFCHLLQESFENFANPCIGKLDYGPTASSIAMGSMLVIWLVDFFSVRWAARRDDLPDTQQPSELPTQFDTPVIPAPDTTSTIKPVFRDMGCSHGFKASTVDLGSTSRRAHWDVQLLEGGIIFHSIMIGVALGAQTKGFAVTFAALVFHQLFEGLGLGTRIGALQWKGKDGKGEAWKKWMMCTMYTLVTPVGISIGIGVHQSFNENGRRELIAIGVLNSISAGILLYGGLCQLLFAEWIIGDMRTTSNIKVVSALIALLSGVFAMALIGKWT